MSPGTAQGSLGCKSTLLLSIHLARIYEAQLSIRDYQDFCAYCRRSAEGLPLLPVDVLIHQGASPKAQVRRTEIFHLSLTLSSPTWALPCKSFATVTNISRHRAEVWSVQERHYTLDADVGSERHWGAPVFQSEI